MQVISKSELLQTLKEIQCQMYRARIDGVGAVSWFSDIVNEQPVIEAAPVVHAKWEEKYDAFHDMIWTSCSSCHHTGAKHFCYCCHCGAKMDLE